MARFAWPDDEDDSGDHGHASPNDDSSPRPLHDASAKDALLRRRKHQATHDAEPACPPAKSGAIDGDKQVSPAASSASSSPGHPRPGGGLNATDPADGARQPPHHKKGQHSRRRSQIVAEAGSGVVTLGQLILSMLTFVVALPMYLLGVLKVLNAHARPARPHARSLARPHARTHTRTHTHIHTHTRARARARTHTHTHTYGRFVHVAHVRV